MRIHHQETGFFYEITEQNDNYKLFESASNRYHTFKEAYEGIWYAIEQIRNISLDKIEEDHFTEIAKRSNLSLASISKSLTVHLKKEKISRTYYDQLFLKLLSHFRGGIDSVTVSNKTNFVIDHEVAFLFRKSLGTGSVLQALAR